MTQYGNIPLSSDLVEKMKQFQVKREEERWEEQRKDEVKDLLECVKMNLNSLQKETSSPTRDEAISILSQAKEEIENKKDSLTEKEFNILSDFVAYFCDATQIR